LLLFPYCTFLDKETYGNGQPAGRGEVMSWYAPKSSSYHHVTMLAWALKMIPASHGLLGSAGLKTLFMPNNFRWAILTHKAGQADLVFGVQSGFISRSECSGYNWCLPGYIQTAFWPAYMTSSTSWAKNVYGGTADVPYKVSGSSLLRCTTQHQYQIGTILPISMYYITQIYSPLWYIKLKPDQRGY